jgi:hypothetical protein
LLIRRGRNRAHIVGLECGFAAALRWDELDVGRQRKGGLSVSPISNPGRTLL